jgi:hypothetical protein
LLVEVTQSQNWFHAEAPERCWIVAVMRSKGVSLAPAPGGKSGTGRMEGRSKSPRHEQL